MPDQNNRTTESEFSEIVLKILLDFQNGEASYAELIEEIPSRITLTPSDLAQSDTRENEAVWEQRVRNITSHKDANGNYINDGFLEPIKGGLRITELGRKKATKS